MSEVTKISDLINPQVMSDMISAKIEKKIVVTPFAKVDTTLVGVSGDTITVPQYSYVGDAEDVAEGVACGTVKLETSSTQAKVKKVMKNIALTDEAVLSGYGNPIGEATTQVAKSIASKIDADCMDALQGAQLKYDGTAGVISYSGVVNALDLFEEEMNSEKVMFINPKQTTQLRLDKDFIDKSKYGNDVMLTGEIGMIGNARIVPSKRVPLNEDETAYICPIVKLVNDTETEDETPALTIYMKRDTNVETPRDSDARITKVNADKIYTCALSNSANVVLASYKKEA